MSQFEEKYRDEVGDPWKTECGLCQEWMKMSFNDILACPVCDMADERYDPQLENPVVWPAVYGEFDDNHYEAWMDDDETLDDWNEEAA